MMLWVNPGLGPKRNGTCVFVLVVYMFAFEGIVLGILLLYWGLIL